MLCVLNFFKMEANTCKLFSYKHVFQQITNLKVKHQRKAAYRKAAYKKAALSIDFISSFSLMLKLKQ